MSKPKAPSNLRPQGIALWQQVVSKYELRADELAVLAGACRAADMISSLESSWAEEGSPLYTKGSMGQLVEHPTPKAIRAWQAAQDQALARLKLPDDHGEQQPRSTSARAAAQSRWTKGGA